jgi:cytochrome P450
MGVATGQLYSAILVVVSAPTPDAYDPFSPAVKRDPYPFYAALRRDAPVFHVAARGMWAVSRYADVAAALKRPDLFSSSVNADRAEIPASETLLGADPPAHTALRKRVERAFTPARVRELAPRLEGLARRLTADIGARGACDAIRDLAAPLPVMIIAELMGIEPSRHEDFKRWSDAVIARGTGVPSPLDRAELDRRVAEFKAHLADVIQARRRAPGDDLVSALVRDQGDDAPLAPAQALNFAVLLLLGGSETTTNLIGNTLRALLADEAARARVLADPALLPAVVDEALRFDAPVQVILRRTTGEVELAGQRVPAGATVLLLLGSANRDERVFPEPERFLLDRADLKHLAFGLGPHYCLGATLARMEAVAALTPLLALPSPRLARVDVELVDSFVLRGPRALELSFGG